MDPTALASPLGISNECIKLIKMEQERPPTDEQIKHLRDLVDKKLSNDAISTLMGINIKQVEAQIIAYKITGKVPIKDSEVYQERDSANHIQYLLKFQHVSWILNE